MKIIKSGRIPVAEKTGTYGVCNFYDLGNLFKVFADDENDGFWIAGGCFFSRDGSNPLADFRHKTDGQWNEFFEIGWIVFEKK